MTEYKKNILGFPLFDHPIEPTKTPSNNELRKKIFKISLTPIRQLTGQDMDGSIGLNDNQIDKIEALIASEVEKAEARGFDMSLKAWEWTFNAGPEELKQMIKASKKYLKQLKGDK